MIKVQQSNSPVRFLTDNDGRLIKAECGVFHLHCSCIYGVIDGLNLGGWTPETLRYVADTLEEARANGGKLVLKVN